MNGYRQGLKITVGLMPYRFRCQTHVTALNVGLDVVPEGWPVVLMSQQLAGFFDAKMARQKIIVMTAD